MPEQHRQLLEILAQFRLIFPNLKSSRWLIKSPFSDDYRCISWAACHTDIPWWPVSGDPQIYWPVGVPLNESLDAFTQAFAKIGYKECQSERFELGFQKIAIFVTSDLNVTHMARQHFFGFGWLSKCGVMEDILHTDLRSIEGDPNPLLVLVGRGTYGKVAKILKRSWLTALIEGGLWRGCAAAFRFWIYRLKHPALVLHNLRQR